MSDADHLPPQVAAHYRIGPRLSAAWRQVYGAPIGGLATPEPGSTDAMWSHFSLTANLRGEDLAWRVTQRATRGWPTLRGLRALDVGTGLGGTAIGLAAFGAETTAVDVDDQLLRLARANAADQGAAVSFRRGDIADPEAGLGRYHAIVAEDVLEHVPDAEQAITAIAGLLEPGGLLLATIPNGDAVAFVAADGHYLLPGLTLLRHRPHAAAYVAARLPHVTYDVGNYHTWDAYRAWLAGAGLEVAEVEHVDPSPRETLDDDLAAAQEAVATAAADPSLPAPLPEQLRAGWQAYRERVAAVTAMPTVDRERRMAARAWRIYAFKGRPRRRFQWRGPSAPSPECWRELGRRIPGAAGLYRAVRRRRRR